MATYIVTAPDGGRYKVTADNDEAANAAVTDLMRNIAPAAKAESSNMGFGENPRAAREQEMPETADTRREIEVGKRVAQRRPEYGLGDVFQSGFTMGLKDEAEAAGSGLASWLKGEGFGAGYDIEKEAIKRLDTEVREKSPILAPTLEIAGGVVSGTPTALATRAPLAAGAPLKEKAARLGMDMYEGAKAGAVVGGITGAAEGEGLQDRAMRAALGLGLGGTIGGAAPAVIGGVGALARPVTNTVRGIINPEAEAARRVSTGLARDADVAARTGQTGGALDDAAYQAALKEGQPVILADTGGETTNALLRSSANTSAQARQRLEGATRGRFETQTERVDDVLGAQSRMSGSADDFLERSKEASRAANAPAYKEAYQLGDTDIWTPTLERLTQSPAMQTALKNAIRKSKDADIVEGFAGMNPRVSLDDADNLVFRASGGLPAYPNLRLWDLTKRELDSLGSQAARRGDADARIYEGLSKQLRAHFDSIPVAGPAYAKARETAAKFFGEADAFTAGQAFAKSKGLNPTQAMKAVGKMSPEEKALFREGYIQAEREKLAKLRDGRDVVINIMQSPDARTRARIALGKGGAEKLTAQLEVEAAMNATRAALGNSSTARQLTELGLAGGAGSGLAGYSTGDFSPSNLTLGAAAGGFAKFGKGKIDERVARRVGDLLVSTDPKAAEKLVQLAAKSPTYAEALRAIRIGITSQIGATVTSP